jgi:hypothetical protein
VLQQYQFNFSIQNGSRLLIYVSFFLLSLLSIQVDNPIYTRVRWHSHEMKNWINEPIEHQYEKYLLKPLRESIAHAAGKWSLGSGRGGRHCLQRCRHYPEGHQDHCREQVWGPYSSLLCHHLLWGSFDLIGPGLNLEGRRRAQAF